MSSEAKCPIWGSPATFLGKFDRDGSAFESPRAGGKYFITGSAEASAALKITENKVKLTHDIVTANMNGDMIDITDDTLFRINELQISGPNERAERLLEYFIKQSRYVGMKFSFPMDIRTNDSDNMIFIGFEWGASTAPLFAYSDSTEKDEISFLIEILESDGLIRLDRPGQLDGLTVMPLGYAQSKSNKQKIISSQAFIAMWFDSSMDNFYRLGIEPAVHKCGYKPVRVDRIEHINKIDDQIIAEIRRSKFLIADFTSEIDRPRGGVYFEAGFALGLGLPVIWTCRHDQIDNVHFDTRQFNHIVWSDEIDLEQRLTARIRATIT